METRISHLLQLLKQYQLDAIALNPGPTLTYLTGLEFHLMERPTVMLVSAEGTVGLILPALEQQKLLGLAFDLAVYLFGDDPATWQQVFSQALAELGLANARIGVEPARLRVLELRFLEKATPDADFIDASSVFAELRMCKDQQELDKMRKAALIAQQALLETLKTVRTGMSERQIASELVIQLYRAGSDITLPFQPIVSSGPNSANPHAVPSDRILQEGDLLLFDWGASFESYYSDITRTFAVGNVDPELLRIGDVVLEANTAGRTVAKAGMQAGFVDEEVRKVISDAGYGPWFTHRTGHGLGMEAHEPPYIYTGNEMLLGAGMTFTIEPGIYLPGRGGVRIEDDVVITLKGLESLTDLPRKVVPLESMRV